MKVLKNERGVAAFYSLWLLGITAILLIFIVNIVKIYAANAQAGIGADQACLTATDDVYHEVEKSVRDYDESLEGHFEELFQGKSIGEQISDEESRLNNQYPKWSIEQLHWQAIDNVLSRALSGNSALQNYIANGLESALPQVKGDIKTLMEENHAEKEKTKFYYFNDDERMAVITAAHFKASKWDRFFQNSSDDIPRKSECTKIDFLSKLHWTNQVISFEP